MTAASRSLATALRRARFASGLLPQSDTTGRDTTPDTKVGTFTQALYDEAKKDGWFVISMKGD